MSFQDEFTTEQLVTFHVRRVFEFLENGEMRFGNFHRVCRGFAFFQHEKYPRNGCGPSRNAFSRYAVQRSRAVPIASSVRLLKLLPNDGPTWDFASIAAISLSSLTTRRSHSFVGLKKPGSSRDLLLNTNCLGIPAAMMRSVNSVMNPSICAPPVTAARAPWSDRPESCCLLDCAVLVVQ